VKLLKGIGDSSHRLQLRESSRDLAAYIGAHPPDILTVTPELSRRHRSRAQERNALAQNLLLMAPLVALRVARSKRDERHDEGA
jgi:hypothetical protein